MPGPSALAVGVLTPLRHEKTRPRPKLLDSRTEAPNGSASGGGGRGGGGVVGTVEAGGSVGCFVGGLGPICVERAMTFLGHTYTGHDFVGLVWQ